MYIYLLSCMKYYHIEWRHILTVTPSFSILITDVIVLAL
jgi:hypothetical protein